MNKRNPKRRPTAPARSKPSKANSATSQGKPEDTDDFKDVYGPDTWLDRLKRGTICLFPGIQRRGLRDMAVSFRDCLPFLAGCDTLVFCELNRTLAQIRDQVQQQAGVMLHGIQIRVCDDIQVDLPVTEVFPGMAGVDWIPQAAEPNPDRFWWYPCRLEIQTPGGGARQIDLLHLGIGGQAVWVYFLSPHALNVTRIIVDPRGDLAEIAPVGQPEHLDKGPATPARPDAPVADTPELPPPAPSAGNTSGFDRTLFERVLEGVRDPVERVKTVLLWRGFLVEKDQAGLFLCAGSADGDAEILQAHGFSVQQTEGHLDHAAEILNPGTTTNETLFGLFNREPPNHLPGPFGFDKPVNQNWDTFTRCGFGAKIPVWILDPGIALLVKILPLLGLHVIAACDGHLTDSPWIRLLSRHHLNWARLVLPIFAPRECDFQRHWVFYSEDWISPRWSFREDIGVWLLRSDGCGESLENRFAFYSNIQRLANNVMQGTRASRQRLGKGQLASAQRLERAAELREELRATPRGAEPC